MSKDTKKQVDSQCMSEAPYEERTKNPQKHSLRNAPKRLKK
jgi:hypothetical protein